MKVLRAGSVRKVFLVALLSLAAFVVSILAKNVKKEDEASGSLAHTAGADVLPVAHAEDVSCAGSVGGDSTGGGSDSCSSAAACGSGCGSGSGGCSGATGV